VSDPVREAVAQLFEAWKRITDDPTLCYSGEARRIAERYDVPLDDLLRAMSRTNYAGSDPYVRFLRAQYSSPNTGGESRN